MRHSSLLLLLLACALVTHRSEAAEQTAAQSDPIAQLVTRLSASYLWRNGTFPQLDLPATASTDEVIARVFAMTGFDEGSVTHYRILETRLVEIAHERVAQFGLVDPRRVKMVEGLPYTYIAALVRTDFGDKIVLLKYEGAPTGWWSRVYDPRLSD